MYLHLFFLLFSSGVSTYFLPLKETPHLQNKNLFTVIDEMLCLLEAEKETINVDLLKPLHIKKQSCAHYNTQKFISELEKIHTCKCMKIVEKDLRKLEEKCSFLKKPSDTETNCSDEKKTDFSDFKKGLEDFLKWVNMRWGNHCNIMRSELDLYLNGNCSCPDPWKHHRQSRPGSGQGEWEGRGEKPGTNQSLS